MKPKGRKVVLARKRVGEPVKSEKSDLAAFARKKPQSRYIGSMCHLNDHS